jgi:peptidoglycan/LPS O-acetylase OafA/YrhL
MNPASGAETGTSLAHVPALDGVRGIAILLVMQVHVALVAPYMLRWQDRDTVAYHFVHAGKGLWIGVDLFFVLSGFLITSILLRSVDTDGGLRTFYARRFLRIVPLYVVFLAVLLYVLPLILELDGISAVFDFEPRYQPSLWLFASNFPWSFVATEGASGPVHLWSIAVEEQFYLLWPFVVLALNPRTLARVCLGLAMFAFIIRVAIVATGDVVFTESSTYHLPFARMDPLVLGAFLACILPRHQSAGYRSIAAGVAAVGAIIIIAIWVPSDGLDVLQLETRTIGFSAVAMLFAGSLYLVLTAPSASAVQRLLSAAPLRFAGKYSYAAYLFHLPLFALLADEINDRGGLGKFADSFLPAILAFEVAAIVLTFALAWLSWRLLEHPVLSLKRHFPYRSRPAPTSARPATAPPALPAHEGGLTVD